MKNIILSIALVVLTITSAMAQNTKGDWYVGTGDITNTAWTELSIQPTIGYAFSDNYMVGMNLTQADSTEDMSLGLEGRYFHKGFFGYVALNDFDFDQLQTKLDSKKLLCIIPNHIFGRPADLDRLRSLIDD